jgi:hypothetical protein
MFVAVFIMSFTINNTQTSNNDIVSESIDNTVLVHVIDCSHCKTFAYCIDAGTIVQPGMVHANFL